MTLVHSKALNEDIEINRIIASVEGESPGPTLVFMGGIHGNEPAGVFAMKRIHDQLKAMDLKIKGNVYFMAGNLNALANGIRFETEDLNRVWTRKRMDILPDDSHETTHAEMAEQVAINNQIRDILKHHTGPFYFFDIHTTSSETLPFITVNDSLLNRAYTSQYPIPIILGIEEYLNGPLLSYITELGYIAFGFEAGQHDDLASIENAEAFCYLSMVFTGAVNSNQIDIQHYYNLLAKHTGDTNHVYEIFFRYLIKEKENFQMKPGFYNFQQITKNQLVAESDGQEIRIPDNGRIFMPLYQSQGTDGFFVIREIKRGFLNLSTRMRKYKLNRFLVWLPGVNWLDQRRSALVIDQSTARFMAKQLLHLLGYRSVERENNVLLAYNRESARKQEYSKAAWFNRLYKPI